MDVVAPTTTPFLLTITPRPSQLSQKRCSGRGGDTRPQTVQEDVMQRKGPGLLATVTAVAGRWKGRWHWTSDNAGSCAVTSGPRLL